MSLQTKYSIVNYCTRFEIIEETGSYDSVNNLYGYGAPNALTTDITGVSILVTNPSGVSYTFTDCYSTYFPDSTLTNEYVLQNTSVGLDADEALTDGLWKFTFTSTTSGATYTKSYYHLVSCAATCCINKLMLQVSTTDCESCTSTVMDKATQAYMFLKVAKVAATDNEPALAQAMMDNANLICSAFNCNSCN